VSFCGTAAGDDAGEEEAGVPDLENCSTMKKKKEELEQPASSAGVFSVVSASWWQRKIEAYGTWLLGLHTKMNNKFFVPLFLNVADYPYRYVIAVIIFSFIFPAISFATGRFVIESNVDALVVPPDSYPPVQKAWLLDHFGVSVRSLAIIHAKGDNVISEEALSLAFDAADIIPTLVDYAALCEQNDVTAQGCVSQSITMFWNSREEYETDLLSLETESEKYEYILDKLSSAVFPSGIPVTREVIFGHHQEEENGQIISASSFLLSIGIPISEPTDAQDFETDYGTQLDALSAAKKSSSTVMLESWNRATLDEDIKAIIDQDLPLVFASMIVMALFTAFAMTRWSKNTKNQRFVTSNFALGLGATATVILSAMTGYGFCTLCGLKITYMTQVLPFVLFGIGVDDSFVIVGAYYETDPSLPFRARIREMAHLSAPSITATTATDMLAFALGASSTIPIIRWFAIYAVVCVFIDYVYQITFFVALFVIDHNRTKNGRYDLFCCFKAPEPLEEEPAVPSCQAATTRRIHRSVLASSVREAPSKSRDWVRSYTKFLFKPITKICVLIFFTALFVVGAVLASKVTVDFNEKELTAYDSQTNRFSTAFDEYYVEETGLFPGEIYYHDIDFSNSDTRQQMLDFRQDIISLGADSYPRVPSFVEDFQAFVLETSNETAKMPLNEQLDIFFNISAYQTLYGGTVRRDEATGGISRIKESVSVARGLTSARERVGFLVEQRAVTLDQPINEDGGTSDEGVERMFFYESGFPLFEHLRVLPTELLLGLSLSIFAVAVVTMFFTPHPTCVLISVLIVTVVDVEIVGVIVASGGNLEPSSMTILIMSIGLVVDYCLHIIHAYLHVDSMTRAGRAKLAVEKVGISVLLGGLTTFLGVTVLAFSEGAVFFRFFVLFSSMVALGMTHGLIFLPVLLSYIGPEFVVHENTLIPSSTHFSLRSSGRKSIVLMQLEALQESDVLWNVEESEALDETLGVTVTDSSRPSRVGRLEE
jgi:Niemann-Pick C1 protein